MFLKFTVCLSFLQEQPEGGSCVWKELRDRTLPVEGGASEGCAIELRILPSEFSFSQMGAFHGISFRSIILMANSIKVLEIDSWKCPQEPPTYRGAYRINPPKISLYILTNFTCAFINLQKLTDKQYKVTVSSF